MSDDQIIGGLVNRLRGLACPAGEPWTGTTPESDHGHTDCFIIHRAADALEAAEAENAQLREDYGNLAAELGQVVVGYRQQLAAIDALHRGEYDVDPDSFTMGQKFCVTDDEEWPCPTHRILHPEEGQ